MSDKPKAKLLDLRIVELSGVDRPCHTPATVALMKRAPEKKEPTAVAKRSALTTSEQGHTHLLYGIDDAMAGTTSYESTFVEGQTNGSYTGHCHPWVRSEDGSIVVGEAMGHTHQVDAMSANLAKGAQSKSTPGAEMHHRPITQEDHMATDNEKIADLTAKLAKAERIAKLSGAHKAYFDTLAGDDAEAFLAKSSTERDALVTELAKRAEDANKVVYTSKSTGDAYRAKDDARLIEMAKRMDAQAEAIEKAEVRKLAADVLAGVAGDDDTHDYIVKSVRKGGGDAAMIDKALATLRSSKEFAKQAAKAKGFGGTEPSEGDAVVKFNTELATFAKNLGKPVAQATEAFLNTAEGAALYAATRQPQA